MNTAFLKQCLTDQGCPVCWTNMKPTRIEFYVSNGTYKCEFVCSNCNFEAQIPIAIAQTEGIIRNLSVEGDEENGPARFYSSNGEKYIKPPTQKLGMKENQPLHDSK